MVDRSVDAKQTFYRMLRDENGSSDLVVDGSATPVKFRCGLNEPRVLHLARLNFIMQDSNFNEDGWFDTNIPLPIGLEFRIVTGSTGVVVASFNQEYHIRKNIDWGILAGNDVFVSTAFQGVKETAFVRWTIERSGARVLVQPDQCFEMLVQDDLTGNDRVFRAMVQGFLAGS